MITIIGGGVFGLSIGWYLARAGRAVTILEKDRVGRGATWVAAGMLMPWKLSNAFSDDLFALQRESHRLWHGFAEMLSACSAVDIHYQTEGRYFVALDEKAVKRFRRQFSFHRKLGFPLEWLTGDEARQRIPALGPSVQAAMFSPMGHWVDNRALIKALKEAFLQAGGTLREGAEVTEILIEQEQVRGICVGDETVSTETVILAAGAQLTQLGGVPENLYSLIQPLKGQSITVQMNPAKPLIEQPLIGPVYLVPRPNGHLIIGTTVEEDAGFDTSPTAGGMVDILGKAQEIVPGIQDLPVVEMGAGTRPTGPNRLPVLGPTSINGLIVASGGHSYGILLAPIVAQTITEFVLTNQTSDIVKPFFNT
jgi:glycine oxidase